ncbi:hypothetical protein [Saccharomonospora cyanea]|uniref:Uncharacterized protein n=1 Tax=Saccharomonospora cyanea NA-134 TaxID=882082 RepID=H5XDS8_9PSEU|nr:hypothetical protein [Saccharomonospora cyanea]EHR62408.1 hypothetical protein SaccyDRAFT_3580 [Saccharomonospora cyanea NA-134]
MRERGASGGDADAGGELRPRWPGVVGHRSVGDHTPLTVAVLDTRLRALECVTGSGPAVERVRREAADVERWESRRRRRHVRLWVVCLEVRAAACDAVEAEFRLSRYVRRPQHRIGDVPVLRHTGVPEPDASGGDDLATYPSGARACRHDRTPFGELERAHVAAYVQGLALARARLLEPSVAVGPARADDGPSLCADDPELRLWRVRHRVLCLAGPGEAPARAAELAATVVDDAGRTAARVVDLRADDGYVDGEGRRVHPAAMLQPHAATALWDDYDAVEADLGQPSVVADVLGRAAVAVWKKFADEARSVFR